MSEPSQNAAVGALGHQLARQAILGLVRQPDASRAIFEQAVNSVDAITELATRELFAFLSGYSEALVAVGMETMADPAARLRSDAAEGSPASMRTAIRNFLNTLAALQWAEEPAGPVGESR